MMQCSLSLLEHLPSQMPITIAQILLQQPRSSLNLPSSLFTRFPHRRSRPLRYQRLGRRIRLDNLSLDLRNPVLRLQNANLQPIISLIPISRPSFFLPSPFSSTMNSSTYHTQQPPRRIARLRTYTNPIPRSRNVQPDVFPWPAVCVAGPWGLRLGVVGAEDFEGAGVARRPIGIR